jgi:CBS domain-containing protein
MHYQGKAQRVLIYVGEDNRFGNQPLYMAVLEYLRANDALGATVTRGVAGFGARSRIHTAGILDLSADLPIRIEWVDVPTRVAQLMPAIRGMVEDGLITVEEVDVVQYAPGRQPDPLALPIGDAMHTPVTNVTPETGVADIVTFLLDDGHRCLPVIDAEQRVVGIITDADLLEHTGLHARLSLQRALSLAEFRAQFEEMRASALTAAQIMTPGPETVRASAPLSVATELMRTKSLKRIPVVDEADRLVGIITRVDVLRVLEHNAPSAGSESPRQLRDGASIAALMNRSVPTVGPAARLEEIVQALEKSHQLRVVVVDSRRHPLGIITYGDLLARSASNRDTGLIRRLRRLVTGAGNGPQGWLDSNETAVELMTRPVFSIDVNADLMEALHLMLRHQIKRLPVVDADGALVGLLGRGNLLRGLASEA